MEIKYLSNPDLPFIKRKWKGNPTKGKSFLNEQPSRISMLSFAKSRLHNPQKEERKNDTFQVVCNQNSDFVNSDEDMIVWLGHASFFIRLGGVTILTDPSYFGFPMRPRKVSIPCEIDTFKFADYLLISHLHHDHADTRSIRKIFKGNQKTKALIPLKGSSLLKYFTKNYQEAGWFQQYQTKSDIEIYFLPSSHWSRMHIFDGNSTLWGSFIIRGNGKTIYFGGDTAWGNHFEEISKLFPQVDYALLPIGAYKPTSIAGAAHISPDEAVKAANILGAESLIPMHYGTYLMGQEPLGDPLRRICRINENGKIDGNLNCLNVGEEFLI